MINFIGIRIELLNFMDTHPSRIMLETRILSVTPDNIQALVELSLELWPDAEAAEERDFWIKTLASGSGAAFLCETAPGHYAGFATVSLRTDPLEGISSQPAGYLEGIYVVETQRRRGIGKMLLAAVEDWCRQKGCREMGSDTELQNRDSQFFHAHSGFEEANRIVCYRKTLQ